MAEDSRRSVDLLTAGSGPPVLLLHGYPQTRAAWHTVAPELAKSFTVVVPDLRGYGASTGPKPDAEGITYSKREMARDFVTVMTELGHHRWSVAGHDRGGRVAYRMALDHPERISRLALLDIMTTLDTWEAMDWSAALAAYHWPFLAQDAAFVESMINHDPAAYLDHLLTRWKGEGFSFHPDAFSDYHRAFSHPEVIAAHAADYRAGAGIDRVLDAADAERGARIAAPLLVLRGTQYEPRQLAPAWRRWTSEVTELSFDCGHFLAEEVPTEVTQALHTHFTGVADSA